MDLDISASASWASRTLFHTPSFAPPPDVPSRAAIPGLLVFSPLFDRSAAISDELYVQAPAAGHDGLAYTTDGLRNHGLAEPPSTLAGLTTVGLS